MPVCPRGKTAVVRLKNKKTKNKQFRNFSSYPDAGEIEFEV